MHRFNPPFHTSRMSLLAALVCSSTAHAYDVTTYHNDAQRTGWNAGETVLNPANVGSNKFKALKQIALSDQVDAQPLVLSASTLNGWGLASKFPNDVVLIATEGNDILAIDSLTGATLMQRNLGTAVNLSLVVPSCVYNAPKIGIKSTPVIDLNARVLYAITYTWENNAPVYRIHALNLTDLSDNLPSVVITAKAALSDGSLTTFNPATQHQRPALLLSNGNVYAGFGSYCDLQANASRGWVIGWNASTLQPLANAELTDQQTANQATGLGWNLLLSSVWMSGYGLAADSQGNVFLQTGNSNGHNNNNYPDSVIELTPSLSRVADYFTPSNFASLDAADEDRGSAGVMVVPDQANGLQFAVASGKDGRLFLFNRGSGLGGFVAGGPDKPSFVKDGGCWGGTSSFVGPGSKARIVSAGGTNVRTWLLPTTGTGTLTLELIGPALPSAQDPGFVTSVSSNGTQPNTAIIWSVSRSIGNTVYLQALGFSAAPSTLTDTFGKVWSFGSKYEAPSGYPLLLNGSQAAGGLGVLMEIDIDGVLWTQNGQGNWYKYNGSVWTAQSGPPQTTIVRQSPPGSTITPNSGAELVDAFGNVWSFGSTYQQPSGYAILINGVQTPGWGGLMEIDGAGILWVQNQQGGWWKYNYPNAVSANGWVAKQTPPQTTVLTQSPAGSPITGAGGGTLVDGQGHVWSFFGANYPTRGGYALLLDGFPALGGFGVLMELDGNGVLWTQNAAGTWWNYVGLGAGNPTPGWAMQHGPPGTIAQSLPGSTIWAAYQSLPLLQTQVNTGSWATPGANANIVPTIANGKVYVASFNTLTIWGLGTDAE